MLSNNGTTLRFLSFINKRWLTVSKRGILAGDEAKRLIDTANPQIKPILIVALNTGMRRNEILSLKWKNVNFAKGFIFIENSKSGRSRDVPMNLLVCETLKDIKPVSEFVFFNPQTKSYIKDIKRSFKTACRKVDIKDLRFHDLRHTAASKMIETGTDIVTCSKILGHSDIKMTMRYCHPTFENMQKAVDMLGYMFKKTRHKVDTSAKVVDIKKPVTHLYLDN